MLLMLEFKLFALRHPKMRARLASAHRRIRASLNYEGLRKLLPWDPDTERDELDKVLLEVVLMGLVLEHAYDPKRLSAKQTVEALGRAFDMFFAVQHLRPTAALLPSANPGVSTHREAAGRRAGR
jgi:hypothetical protein